MHLKFVNVKQVENLKNKVLIRTTQSTGKTIHEVKQKQLFYKQLLNKQKNVYVNINEVRHIIL